MKTKEVTLFGANGLIGESLLFNLIRDKHFEKINVVSRKLISLKNKKVSLHRTDFLESNSINRIVKNSDVVFVCIGTTMNKVKGNKKEFRKIDFDISYKIAKACKENKVSNLSFVSSSGANPNSSSFYLKVKGETEQSIKKLNLYSTYVFRPSLLLGKRKEKRLGEKIAQSIMPLFSFIMPSRYKPISSIKVAKAMVRFSKIIEPGFKIFHYKEMN